MALGFGFNKAKVLSAAEKFVQQGKFSNAIAEYEKVIKNDPKDLTVLNTVGDLYARLGQAEQAVQYFRQVGEAYASDGFNVKAIAMYKKIAKLTPNVSDCVLKLAELYSQQGLFNDARAQYLQVADTYLKTGKQDQACQIFQKMLEMDPSNTVMQAKLADLYVKMGKSEEARNILFGMAETQYKNGAIDAAEKELERIVKLDANFAPALMLRGQINSQQGKHEQAVQCLERVANLDSKPDALRALLRSEIALGNVQEAVPLANKLFSVHHDVSGIASCAEALLNGGEHSAALRLYEQYSEQLLAANATAMLNVLRGCIDRIKEDPAALEMLRSIYEKAGETTNLNEVLELLAHALVQQGELERARDLYKQLADSEPENPLHSQNYKQVVAKLGEDPTQRPLTQEQSSQAFMVDELEISGPALEPAYSLDVAEAVKAAITESELLDSYNLAWKAVTPLEQVLPQAPLDPLLNQRLASLYARAERYSEAAKCCDTLRSIYWKAGHSEFALRYQDMARKYRQRAGEPEPERPAEQPTTPPKADVVPPAGPSSCATSPATQAAEIDLSSEWEQAAQPQVAEQVEVVEQEQEGTSQFISAERALAGHLSVMGDMVEEIRFYVAQGMVEEAKAALEKCAALDPELPDLKSLRKELDSITRKLSQAAETPEVAEIEVEIEHIEENETKISTHVFEESELAEAVPEPPVFAVPEETPAVAAKALAQEAARVTEPTRIVDLPVAVPAPTMDAEIAAEVWPVTEPEAATSEEAQDALTALVMDLEGSLGTDFNFGGAETKTQPSASVAPPAAPPKPAAPAAAAMAAAAATVIAPVAAVSQAQPVAVSSAAQKHRATTASVLSDLFEEFKDEVEEQSSGHDDDPETHYNLGVAFREMGLLDEAIGELQKVCHAIDSGHSFSRKIETYTWLSQCLVDKGAPQAAIRWYERALKVPGISAETTTAIHYDMAVAYEAAGNTQAALDHFMEVYGTNIDYRDVAERIKSLQSVVKS